MTETPPSQDISSQSTPADESKRLTRAEWRQQVLDNIYDKTEHFTSQENMIHRVLDNPKQMFDYIHKLETDREEVEYLIHLLNIEKLTEKITGLEKKRQKAARRARWLGLVVVILGAIAGVLCTILMGAGFWKFLKRNECAAYVGEWKISRV